MLTPAVILAALAPISDIYVDASANCAVANGSVAAPFCTLAAAVSAATGGDRIIVAPAVYANWNVALTKDLTIVGSAGAESTIVQISPNQIGSTTASIGVAPNTEVVFEGLTFTGASNGGGAISSQGTLTMRRCVVRDNEARDGFWLFGATLAAGVLQSGAEPLTIEACEFMGNDGIEFGYFFPAGGLAVLGDGPVVIRDSRFHDNRGGHVRALAGSNVIIEGSTFSGETRYLGGLQNSAVSLRGTAELLNSTFASTFHAVTVESDASDTVRIRSCTLGSTVVQWSGQVSVGNSIFAGLGVQGSLRGNYTSEGFNLVALGQLATGFGPDDLVGTASSPVDAGLGLLADHGGPTPTIALDPTSPAIAAGDQADFPTVDQRGRIRRAGSVDIGAYQSSSPSLSFGVPGCWGRANGSGRAGQTAALGSAVVSANDLAITAIGVTPNQFGLFLVSRESGFTALMDGNLCLSGTIGRFGGPGEVQNSGPSGSLLLELDLTRIPQGSFLASGAPGETWYFQAWHRDTLGESSFAVATAVTLE